jgi:hypothetical protein
MPATIPVLWSDDISVDVLAPIAILRAQAGPLSQKTKGLLVAGIETITSESGTVQHQFDLVAPVLNKFRRRILIATHQIDLVYPVTVEAECYASESFLRTPSSIINTLLSPREEFLERHRRAATDQDFMKLVGEVFHSVQVRSLIQSLIARSNEQKNTTESSEAVNEESPE